MEDGDITESIESRNNDVDLTECKSVISNLEANEQLLIIERNKLKEDFGQQRAKLKDLYIQKEEEVKVQVEKSISLSAANDQKKILLKQLQRELDDLRSQVTIAQCTAENEVEVERRKCTEEIASVTQILKEEQSINELEIDHLRKKINNLEVEKYHYRSLYEQKLEECDSKREESLFIPGMLSTVTKNFVRKVPSLNSSQSNIGSLDKASSQLHDCSPNNTVSSQQAESLEESMIKAQESTTVLKSLVVPLEEEIVALKNKIREQDTQLRAKEALDQLALKTSDMIGPLLQGRPMEELIKELDIKLHGLKKSLKTEKSTRADLELYAAILNTQKTALTDQVERLRDQLQELGLKYNEERKVHSELRILSQKTNSKFVEEQRRNLFKMRTIKSFLTVDQLRKINDVMESNIPIEENLIEISSDKLSYTEAQSVNIETSKFKKIPNIYEESMLENSSSNICIKAVTPLKLLPDKLPQLTDDQKRALSGTANSSEQQLIELESPTSSSRSQVVVNEGDWLLLQEEINNYQKLITQECKMCTELESKLKTAESDLKDSDNKIVTTQKAIGRMKEELEREVLYRKQSHLTWRQMSEEFEKREKDLQLKIDQISSRHHEIISEYKQNFQRIQEQLSELTKNRNSVNKELLRLQSENDSLVGKHSIRSQELQNEIINLPDTMEEMQLHLLKYREDIITAKIAKEHIEETLNSRLLFINDQLEGEQHEKAALESKLSLEIEQLREKAAMSVDLEAKLRKKRQFLLEMEEKLKVSEQKSIDTLNRSQNFITGLKNQVEEHEQKKAQMENIVSELKNRVFSLQQDLKTSEAVQRDFVRLSQSLQVHLEKIRQSDKEVRWQHEDDIEDCNRCNQKFNAVGRRKHHCKHCGKIFCAECVTKTVTSGPNLRSSRVCDVCHTLLVHDATPFFSSEPPRSPD